ncbi:MAG: hypothetical protein ACK5IP_17075 [Paracoccus sp. (in: a-proteobacteria)]
MGSIPITRSNTTAPPFSVPALSPARGTAYVSGCECNRERVSMSRKATQRLSFTLLVLLTLYASLAGAG